MKFIGNGVASKLEGAFLPQIKMQLDYLESMLDSDYFCGPELSGADIMMSFPLQAASGPRGGLTDQTHPKLAAYLKRIENLSAWKKGVDKIVEVKGSYDGDAG